MARVNGHVAVACAVASICAPALAGPQGADSRTVDFRYAPPWWQTSICLPDDGQKTLVGKDGSLLYDYPGRYSDFKTRIRLDVEGAEWERQELASPRVPIVRTRRKAGQIEILEEAFALPPKGRRNPTPAVERVGSQTTLRDWAAPAIPCDPAFQNIAVGFAQPVHYRVRANHEPMTVVFGLCEGWHKEAGKRILDLQIEGRSRRIVDLAGENGPNVPALYSFDARDEDGDGQIDVAVAAAPGSPDPNTLFNILWVLRAPDTPDLEALKTGAGIARPFARIEGGSEVPGGVSRSDVLLLTFHNTGAAAETISPTITLDSELPVVAGKDGRTLSFGPATVVRFERAMERIEPTKDGARVYLSPIALQAGEQVEIAVQVARGPEAAGQRLSLNRPDSLRSAAERVWNRAKLPYDRIQVPDPAIQALLDSSIRNIYQAREIKNGLPAFQVGPTCYRGLWVVDGSFLLEALTYLGRADEARAGIRYLLSFQKNDGAFSLIDGHWKETGIALWAVTRHARLTGDRKWLAEVWPKVEKGFEYIRTLRQLASKDPAALNCGLIPDGFSDGGLAGRYPEYTNVYWTLVGLKAAADAAQWLGKNEDADTMRREYEDMLAVFRRAAERDMRADSAGNRFVPIRMRDDEKSAPQKAQWGFLHAVFPGRLFAGDDPLVAGNMAMLEATEREGMVYGTGWLNQGIWNYFASFYGHAWLWQGRPEKAVDSLYAFANHASPLLAWREEQMPSGGGAQICGDMPHNWASAEFIRLVRHLLVMERGDELHLLEGLPASWIKPGARIRLKAIVTDFGPLSLSLEVDRDARVAHLRLDGPKRERPAKIVLHMGDWAVEPGHREISSGDRTDIRIPLRPPT